MNVKDLNHIAHLPRLFAANFTNSMTAQRARWHRSARLKLFTALVEIRAVISGMSVRSECR